MNLDKKTVLKIIFIIFVSIIFLVALSNLSLIFSWIETIFAVLTPFIIGLCMAFVLNIPLKLFETKLFAKLNQKGNKRWLRIKRPLSLFLSIFSFIALIALLLVIIIPSFISTIDNFAKTLPEYMEALETKLSSFLSKLTGKSEDGIFEINWQTVSNMLIDFVHKNDQDTVKITIDIISGAVSTVYNIILGFIFSIYILASKEKLARQVKSFMYSTIKRDRVDRFLSVTSIANSSFNRFVVGQCTEALIIGVLCCVGMLIFRMPYAPVISCIIAITALIPVFGAFIGTAAGAFMILLQSPIKALWFVIFILVLQQIETNLIYPKVVGKSVGLPGIWVLFAVMIGGGLFGAFGMLVSVPICSVLYTLAERWINKRLIERNISSDILNKKHSSPQPSDMSTPSDTENSDQTNEKTKNKK